MFLFWCDLQNHPVKITMVTDIAFVRGQVKSPPKIDVTMEAVPPLSRLGYNLRVGQWVTFFFFLLTPTRPKIAQTLHSVSGVCWCPCGVTDKAGPLLKGSPGWSSLCAAAELGLIPSPPHPRFLLLAPVLPSEPPFLHSVFPSLGTKQ